MGKAFEGGEGGSEVVAALYLASMFRPNSKICLGWEPSSSWRIWFSLNQIDQPIARNDSKALKEWFPQTRGAIPDWQNRKKVVHGGWF